MKKYCTNFIQQCFVTLSFLIVVLLFSGCEMQDDGMVVPLVTTLTNIKSVTPISAECSGEVKNNRGAEVTSCGFCWSTSGIPSIKNSKVEAVGLDSMSVFTAKIEGLESKRAYSVRAYAITSKGVGYGRPITVKTNPLSDISTLDANNITATSAECGGDIITDYGFEIYERGVCWKVGSTPTINDSYSAYGSLTGSYVVNVIGLKPNTTYFVRAYSKCSLGVEYGNLKTFNTLALEQKK
jgi:hypothetical protein